MAAMAWADLESAANLLEETKSAVLSQMMLRLGEMPVSKAELRVKASDEWHDHVTKIANARSAAIKAKVRVDYLKMKFSEWIAADANHRSGARL